MSIIAGKAAKPPKNKKSTAGDDGPKYLTVKEFADHFHMSVAGVHKAINAGNLDFIELPGSGEKVGRRIPYSEVKRIESRK